MRPGSWLLLFLLLSTSAAALDGSGGRALQERTLVAPIRPGEVPPLELHVASGVATLVQFEAPLKPGALTLPVGERRIQLASMSGDSLVVTLIAHLADGEQVPLTVAVESGAEPLRFALVTRRDAVDLRVRVARAQTLANEEAAELVARSLLAAPDPRPTLAVPQAVTEYEMGESRARVESVLWMGQRLFVTVAVWSRKKRAPPWTLVQARLRTMLADGALLEWPAHLLSGAAGSIRQRHILIGLLPEGASRLELALDGEDSPGTFRPLPPEGEPTHP